MIAKISHTNVYVLDQQRALDFYTQKLGFEVRTDVKMGESRWLTVGPKEQPDMELILSPISEQMLGDTDAADQLRALVKKGVMCGPIMECEDIYATYKELKSKGVDFIKPPTEESYKTEAVFRDDSGNWFSLGEMKS